MHIVHHAACAEAIRGGGDALYIDFEDGAEEVFTRMLALGVDRAALTAHFLYVRPDEPCCSPVVQPLSIDEAFLDVTGTEKAHGGADAIEIARRLKLRVRDELQLTASVGVAPNKFLAKLA